MKNLIFLLLLLLAGQNISYAGSVIPASNETTLSVPREQKKVKHKRKHLNLKKIKKQDNATLAWVGYYITFTGLALTVGALILAINVPVAASIMLLIGILVGLIGLIFVYYGIKKLEKV